VGVKVVHGGWDEEVDQGEGGESELLHFGGGQDEEAADERRPYLADAMEVEFEDLLDPFEGKDLLGLLRVGILQAFIGDLHQRLQDGLEVLVVILGTLGEEGLHAGVEYEHIVFPLGLEMLLSKFIAIVVEGVVFEGLPEGDPTGGAKEICIEHRLLPRQLAVLRIILLICTWRCSKPFSPFPGMQYRQSSLIYTPAVLLSPKTPARLMIRSLTFSRDWRVSSVTSLLMIALIISNTVLCTNL
jgi:hypothetical protein